MQLKAHITETEFAIIKEAIESTLNLCQYDFIEANGEDGRATAMSKETFFDSLKSNFVIIK